MCSAYKHHSALIPLFGISFAFFLLCYWSEYRVFASFHVLFPSLFSSIFFLSGQFTSFWRENTFFCSGAFFHLLAATELPKPTSLFFSSHTSNFKVAAVLGTLPFFWCWEEGSARRGRKQHRCLQFSTAAHSSTRWKNWKLQEASKTIWCCL